MASADRLAELEQLRLVEERLLRERNECEQLEDQIRALTVQSEQAERITPSAPSFGSAPRRAPPPTPTAPPPPPPGPPPPSALPTHIPQPHVYQSSTPSGGTPPQPPSATSHNGYAATGPATSSSSSMVVHTVSPPKQQPASPSRHRSVSPRRTAASSHRPRVSAKNGYTPPTLGTSERFKTPFVDDVPGPGQYDTPSVFSRTVVRSKPSRSSKGSGTPSSSSNPSNPSNKKPKAKLSATAYDAALRREKQLRRELALAQKNMQQQQHNISQYQATVKEELSSLRRSLSDKKAAYEASQRTVAAWKQVHEKVAGSFDGLIRCVREYGPLFEQTAQAPRFRDIQVRMRSLEDALASAEPLLRVSSSSMSGTGVGAGVTAASSSSTTAGPAPSFVSPVRMTSPGTPRGRSGTPTTEDMESRGISPDAIASFARRAHRQSVAIIQEDARRVTHTSHMEGIGAHYGMDADRVEKQLVRASPRALSPARRPKPSIPSRSPSAKTSVTGVTGALTRGHLARKKEAMAGSDGKGGPPSGETLDDKLRRLYQHYCAFGDRKNTSAMTDFKFVKVLRDARVLDNRVTHHDADVLFMKHVTKSHGEVLADGLKKPGATASARRMSYEAFTEALMELATRKYGGTRLSGPQAFRELITKFLAPLADSLGTKSAMPTESEDKRRAFLDRFMQPDVLKFFNENSASLQSIFTRYCMLETPTGPSVSWNSIRESHTTMSEREWLTLCSDFGMFPGKAKRPEVIRLFKMAGERLVSEGVEIELAYPEFIELLGMLAELVYEPRPSLPDTLLWKLHMLIHYMHESGGRFKGVESRLVGRVTRKVKATLSESTKTAETERRHNAHDQYERVKSILMETAS